MLQKSIILSFCLFVILIFAGMLFSRPNSNAFMPALVLGILGYIIIITSAFLLSKAFSVNTIAAYAVSFIVAYSALMLVLWNINGGDFISVVKDSHTGRDFWGFLLPFIASNIVLTLWLFFRQSKA
ncbi:MAG: hypothetical protein KF746_14685 [Chitinophagaceae bacterium]|nr:hypothetical protein [Chitinophagaceae bacterium]